MCCSSRSASRARPANSASSSSRSPTEPTISAAITGGSAFTTGICETAYWTTPEQRAALEASRDAYEKALDAARYGAITTEIREAPTFYYAEDYHQQYLYKVPNGYCGMGGTGVSCPVPG